MAPPRRPKTPPNTPPGQRPDPELELNYVVSPAVVQAINGVSLAIRDIPAGGSGGPPVDFSPVVDAIDANTAAIIEQATATRDQTMSSRQNSDRMSAAILELCNCINTNTAAIDGHAVALEDHAAAIAANTAAIVALTESCKPPAPTKATAITMSAEIDTESTPPEVSPPQEAKPMPPIQLYPNQKFKVTYTFNGTVDGEPVVVGQGFAVALTQDPKVETQIDATHVETKVTVHGRCTQPQNIVEGDPSAPPEHGGTNPGSTWNIGMPCTATVDNPDTGDTVEKIHEEFADVFQWIPLGAGKATTIGMTPEIEP